MVWWHIVLIVVGWLTVVVICAAMAGGEQRHNLVDTYKVYISYIQIIVSLCFLMLLFNVYKLFIV